MIVSKVEEDNNNGDTNVEVWYRAKSSSTTTISNMDDNCGLDSVFSQVDDIDDDIDTGDHVDIDEQIVIFPVKDDDCIIDDDQNEVDDNENGFDVDEGSADVDEKEEEDNPANYIDDEEEEEEEEEDHSEVVVSSAIDHVHLSDPATDIGSKRIDRKLITILSLISVVFCLLVGRLFIPPYLVISRNNNSSVVQLLPVSTINTTSSKPIASITTTVNIVPTFSANRDSHKIAAVRKNNNLFTEIWKIITYLSKRKQ